MRLKELTVSSRELAAIGKLALVIAAGGGAGMATHALAENGQPSAVQDVARDVARELQQIKTAICVMATPEQLVKLEAAQIECARLVPFTVQQAGRSPNGRGKQP